MPHPKRKKNKTHSMRKEFERQVKEKTAHFPWTLEAFYVERYESDEYGDQVRIAGKIESCTVNTPEAVRDFGNRMKLVGANTNLFNILITCIDAHGKQSSRVLPRKVPGHIQNKQQLYMTTDHRWREKVQKDLHHAKVASQGVGDFDKKPDADDAIERLLDEGEPELDEV